MVDSKQEVLSKIDEREVIELTKQIIRIPSTNPPGKQQDISDFLAGQLRDLGLRVSTPTKEVEKPNVIGTVKGKGPKLLFCGHMDTAPVTEKERAFWTVDPFEGVVKKGKIYGRGAVDMKGGIVSILSAAKAISQAKVVLERDLMVAFFVDEEAGGMEAGSMYLTKSGFMNDVIAALDPEPSDMQVRYMFKGRTIYEIAVTGKSAHSSSPEKAVNAVSKMGKVIVSLDSTKVSIEPHSILGPCTRSFTAIEARQFLAIFFWLT